MQAIRFLLNWFLIITMPVWGGIVMAIIVIMAKDQNKAKIGKSWLFGT